MVWKTTLTKIVNAYNPSQGLLCVPSTLIIAILLLGFTSMKAQTVPVENPTGGFAIEGDLRANTPVTGIGDWFQGTSGLGGYVFNSNGTAVVANDSKFVSDIPSFGNDRFLKGSKSSDNPKDWKWDDTKGGAQSKGDLLHAFYHVGRDGNGDQWLFVGADRVGNNGTSYIDFSFLQNSVTENSDKTFSTNGPNGGRTINDILLTIEYTNGGSNPKFYVYQWKESPTNAGTYEYQKIIDYTDVTNEAYAKVNISGSIVSPNGAFGYSTIDQYKFVEGAINLSAILDNYNVCNNDGIGIETIFVKTKNSDSPSADLEDFISPISVDFTIASASIAYLNNPVCKTSGNAKVTIEGVKNGTFSSTTGLDINSSTGEINVSNSVPGTYTIKYDYTSYKCKKSTSTSFTILASPNAPTGDTEQVFCSTSNPTVADLTALGTNIKWYTSIDGNTLANGSLVVGATYYASQTVGTCESVNRLSVTVKEQAAPNAGTDGTLTVCEGTQITNEMLFAKLNGTPDLGGSWSNNGLVYTYTVAAKAPCTGNATAKVTVTKQAAPNAGTDGTLTICEGTQITNEMLFAKLNGTPDQGGSWSNNGLVYTYTVAATAPCTGNATAKVTVTEQAAPNAGTDGTLTVCESTQITNEMLFAKLNGTPDQGGSWSNNGLVYTYTVTATAPCTGNATAKVTVTEQAAPNAGTDTTLTVCEGTQITNELLFAQLPGADTGGTWTGPIDGVYTYTLEATQYCDGDFATVAVSFSPAPNAGTDTTLTVCEGTEITNELLFAQLAGADAGGTWTGPVDGVYTYTLEATEYCDGDFATVGVSFSTAPNAGTDTTLTVCEGTEITNELLFAQLPGADAGGTWTGPIDGVYTYTLEATQYCDGDFATVAVSFSPAPNAGTDTTLTVCEGTEITNELLFAQLPGADAGGTWTGPIDGVYTYTLEATQYCNGDFATVAVSFSAAPNAGADTTLTVCEGTQITNELLFAQLLGADTGGTWTGPIDGVYTYTLVATQYCDGDFATVAVSFSPAPNAGTDTTLTVCEGTEITNELLFAQLPGADAGGTWTGPIDGVYTYTLEATQYCNGDFATVAVSISPAPNAGTDTTLTVCEGTEITNEILFAQLPGADAGGTWTGPVDGVYTYTLEATPYCDGDFATVAVSFSSAPNAGTDTTLTVCEGTEITNELLFAQLPGADAGGTWTGPIDGVYTYTLEATPYCDGDFATVAVSFSPAPNAGTDGTLTVCKGTEITNEMLFAELNGTPDQGGSWSIDGLVYTYTVAATAPCTGEATAKVTVTEQTAPNAGTDGTLTVCEGTEITNQMLFAELNGTPDQGGSWSNDGLVYTYTVAATAPCTGEATAKVTVTEQEAPNAGTDGTLTVCEGTEITNELLFAQLPGADAGGTWSNDGLVYTYTVAATAPCTGDATAKVTVIEQDIIVAQSFEDQEACDNYILPELKPGNQYFTQENGEGLDLKAGDIITEDQTIYIYAASNGTCPAAESSFKVIINETPVAQSLEDEIACDSFTLKALNEGNHYFTQTGGNGTELFEGDKITSTQTIFIYKESGNLVKCSNETSFKVTINPTPEVPVVSNTGNTTCNLNNGSISITEIEGVEFSIDGNNYQASGLFSDLAPATYSITARFVGGDCISDAVEVEINATPDTEAPTLSEMKDIEVNTDSGICGAVVSFETPTATDNCEGTVISLNEGSLASGSEFPVGTTTVTYTATDAAGNSSTVSFDVKVTDNENPVIACPSAIVTTTETGESYAIVNFEKATATDNCAVTVEQTAGLPSGSQFPIGESIVEFTATDASGNTSTCTVTIIVEDKEPPVISCPENLDMNVDAGICGAKVLFEIPSATDNSGANVTVTQTAGPASGEVFPVGTTRITFTATDAAGNSASCSFDVTVTDNEDPTFEPVSNIEVDTDAGVCGAVVSFEAPTATDNCDGTVVTLNEGSLASGSEFPVGKTTVTYTATDAAGNTSTVSFDVIVTDNENPVIACPANIITTNVVGQDYAVVTYSEVTATDNCGVTVERTSGFASGAQFPIGTTVVTHVATDASGNTTECSFTVLVKGTPVAVDDTVTTNEDTSVVISVLNNDSDPDGDPLSIIANTNPSNGTVVLNENGTFTYIPNANYNGPDSFEYTISDGNGGTATATVSITIVPVNDAPIAVDDSASTNEDTPVTVSVLANDSDVDGDALTVISTTTPSHGTVVINTNGTITYTPNENYNGMDFFEYTISDGNGGTDTALVTITVNAVNDAPVAVDDVATTDEDNAVTISVLDNDSDADGNGLTVISITAPTNGTVIINNDGTVTYTPNADYNGTDSFEYTISDGNGGTDAATVTITVNPVDDTPPAPPSPPSVTVIQATCSTPTGTITVETETGLTYSINGVDYQESGVFADLEPGTYEVTSRTGTGVVSESTSVTINAPSVTVIETTTTDLCTGDDPINLFDLLIGVSETDDNIGTWADPNATGALSGSTLDPSKLEVGTYTFNYVTTGACGSTTEVTVFINDDCIVLPCGLSDIKDSISKAVTPNQDGYNDYFTVDLETDCGFTFNVQIFNRWGAKVFSQKNYRNNWDGFSNKSVTSSNQLPSGTYYYIVEVVGSGFEPIQGYIYLGTK